MNFRMPTLAGLLAVSCGWACDFAEAQNSPNLNATQPTAESEKAPSAAKTQNAVSMSPTSAKMASMAAGTYVLQTTPMFSEGCASCGAYGYSVMGAQMMSPCSPGMGCGPSPTVFTPMTYVWETPVYTTTYVVMPVLINQSYGAFGAMGGGYGSHGGFGGGGHGGGG